MIKTKTYTEHQILCDCGGEIKLEAPKKFNEFSALSYEKDYSSNSFTGYANACFIAPSREQYPTCQKCCKKFMIKFSTNEMKIIMEEVE